MNYWAAHCRGCDYDALRKLGFLVLHPHIDDYVFLEVKDSNKKILRREGKLNILFVRFDDKLMEIPEEEIEIFKGSTIDSIEVGTSILIVQGIYSNLDGKVIAERGDNYSCEVYGYKKIYFPDIKRSYVVRKENACSDS